MENKNLSEELNSLKNPAEKEEISENNGEVTEEERKLLQELIDPKVTMQWLTPAYRQTEKSMAWYAVMGLIVLIFVIYGMFSGDSSGWIVSISFLILAGVYYFNELSPAPAVKVILNQLGIKYGNRFIPFNQLKSFWILNEDNARYLNLIFQKGERKLSIIIPPEVNLAHLREDLLLQIPEEEGQEESFIDQLIRNLGL